MVNDLSREEEQRGWRKLYLWIIPLALILGIVLLFVPTLMNWVSDQEERGMDQVAPQEAATGKQALGPAKLEVKSSTQYGQYITDGSGRPVYLFKGDVRRNDRQAA
jgi:hypothetical protein